MPENLLSERSPLVSAANAASIPLRIVSGFFRGLCSHPWVLVHTFIDLTQLYCLHTGDAQNQIHFEGYQVSNQCMALVRDECLVPTKDSPELGYVKQSSNDQYVPDVFFKVRDFLIMNSSY